MAGWIKMPLGTNVGLVPGHIVLDGDPAPQNGAQHPQFSAHVYCGQTAGCIKMPLVTEVVLRPGDIVLDGNPAAPVPRKKWPQQPPRFGSCALWPDGRPSQQPLCSCCIADDRESILYNASQSREWVDGSWVTGQMGHENRTGHMGHGSLGVDP